MRKEEGEHPSQNHTYRMVIVLLPVVAEQASVAEVQVWNLLPGSVWP
jgi:hypothetical protein